MLTTAEVGKLLRLDSRTVLNHIKANIIPAETKLGGVHSGYVVSARRLVAVLEERGLHDQAETVRDYVAQLPDILPNSGR